MPFLPSDLLPCQKCNLKSTIQGRKRDSWPWCLHRRDAKQPMSSSVAPRRPCMKVLWPAVIRNFSINSNSFLDETRLAPVVTQWRDSTLITRQSDVHFIGKGLRWLRGWQIWGVLSLEAATTSLDTTPHIHVHMLSTH